MLLDQISGVVKKTVRITKPCGGILVKANQGIAGIGGEATGFDNEQIGITIESGSRQIKVISPAASLLAVSAMGTIGEGANHATAAASVALYIPIALGGSLAIDDAAEIVVTLSNLKSAKTYDVYAVEEPGVSRIFLQYDQLTIAQGRKSEVVNVSAADVIFVNERQAVQKMEMVKLSDVGGRIDATNHNFEGPEIEKLMASTNDFVLNGAIQCPVALPATICLPVSAATRIELYMDGTKEHTVLLRKPAQL